MAAMPATSPRPAHSSSARPARSAAPPLPPFEALDRTHLRVMEVLTQFDALLAHLDDNGPDAVARASAAEICSFFSGQARQHHADEERFIFPALLAQGDAVLTQHVLRLQQDHGWLEEDWLELLPQIEAVATGYSWYDLATLRHALPIFRALYEEHIALEESLIYPEAKARQAALQNGASQRTN